MAGLGIGAILCFSNMFFGLETGWVTMGSLQSSVLGYALFHSLRRFPLFQDFTPLENVVLQTTAVARELVPKLDALQKGHDSEIAQLDEIRVTCTDDDAIELPEALVRRLDVIQDPK